jgi:hypothetical protein
MTSALQIRSTTRIVAVALALLSIGACGKKAEQPATETSGGAIAPSSSAVKVADVTLGRGITNEKRVANPTDTFASRDTIFASVHTTGAAPNAILVARWIYQDGQVVNEGNENISPTGDAYTEFHIAKPSGWPAGKYTLHVLVDGQEVQTKDFTVK